MKCVTLLFVTVFVLCNKYNYVQGKFYKSAVPEIFLLTFNGLQYFEYIIFSYFCIVYRRGI